MLIAANSSLHSAPSGLSASVDASGFRFSVSFDEPVVDIDVDAALGLNVSLEILPAADVPNEDGRILASTLTTILAGGVAEIGNSFEVRDANGSVNGMFTLDGVISGFR